ncbi:MAG TPA: signal peptidase I [Candidatus Polarisedimenticolia bacterium]|nr:signal peptidase I [Candidatus Polarisedimenticolia bacterium]
METIVTCVIFVLFARTFVFQQSKIPTGSMIPTLLIGDYIMVNKHVYAPTSFAWERKLLPIREIRRGDIIVFKYPEAPEKDYIKRVIGLPGDVIEVRHRELYLNGVLQTEPYIQHISPAGITLDGDNYAPTKVPPDSYFAMGDNRDNSQDSRVWGFVPRDNVKGRAFVIFWSYEEERDAYLHTGMLDRALAIWSKITHLFTRTRWHRSFDLIR